jgi:hypothetical protein
MLTPIPASLLVAGSVPLPAPGAAYGLRGHPQCSRSGGRAGARHGRPLAFPSPGFFLYAICGRGLWGLLRCPQRPRHRDGTCPGNLLGRGLLPGARSPRGRRWSSSGRACERWHVSSTATEAVLSPSRLSVQSVGRAPAWSRSRFRKPPPGPALPMAPGCPVPPLDHAGRPSLRRKDANRPGPAHPVACGRRSTPPRMRPRPQHLREHRLHRHAPECPAIVAVIVDPAHVIADPTMRHA